MTKILIALAVCLAAVQARDITVYNKCPFTVWPGILGPGNPANGGFRLDGGASRKIQVDDAWTAGRIWARTGCDGNFNCETGFCKNSEQCSGAGGVPPCSLAEFTLKAWGNQDFYDISLVDGYNLPVIIIPNGGNGCKNAGGCNKDINAECPDGMKVVGKSGNTVGCKSACMAFDQDQYCCRGNYGTPDKCPPTQYSKLFKDACPTAYSYAYDDGTSTFTCQPSASYTVQFC